MSLSPPERVRAGPVTIRRWVDADAAALQALVLANLDHLRPWVAWVAAEPLSLLEREAKIRDWTRRWDDGVDFPYAIASGDGDGNGDILGGCGLHRPDGSTGLEIGYWVRGDRVGEGVATHAVAALTEAAFGVHGVDHVEIHHDVANLASRRVPEKNGFELVGEVPDEAAAPSEVGISLIWRLRRPLSPAPRSLSR
jgi:RimJ/RimL family protein N-acetyltransferase